MLVLEKCLLGGMRAANWASNCRWPCTAQNLHKRSLPEMFVAGRVFVTRTPDNKWSRVSPRILNIPERRFVSSSADPDSGTCCGINSSCALHAEMFSHQYVWCHQCGPNYSSRLKRRVSLSESPPSESKNINVRCFCGEGLQSWPSLECCY